MSDFFDIFNVLILIFRIYLYISITILPFVLYNSFFESHYKPNSNYYHKKEWYHFLKVLWAKSAVNKYKKKFSDEIRNESEETLEKPRELTTFMRSDNLLFYGADNTGNSLYIRITLRERRLAESALQIRLSDGQVFQLPEHPLVLISSIPERKWQAGGLEIKIIEPFSILRITYNGFLRNAIRNNEKEELGYVKHCKFDFIWSSSTEAKFFPQEVNTTELAEAVAVEPWKNSKWIKMLGFHTGFDQYGIIEGTFTVSSLNNTPTNGTSFTPSNNTQNLKLFATRTRRWGPKEAGGLHRMLTLFGVDQNGLMFSVRVRSYFKGCKELHVGSAMLPNKKIVFIENCDISLPNFIEDSIIPGAFNFSFEADGQLFKCTAFIDKKSITDMKNEEITGYKGQIVKTKYIINGEEALGYGVFWYRYKGEGIKFPPYIIRPGKLTVEPERKYVTDLSSPECRSINLAGLKGTNLALLSAIRSDKFQTLDGFCILSPALDKYLEKHVEIQEELNNLNEIACGIRQGNLQDVCKRVQQMFTNTPLPQLLQNLVLRELSLLKSSAPNSSVWCWAVRSSVIHQSKNCTEKTFLDCLSDDDVIQAVSKCWAGVYDYNKVLFRRQFGLPIINKMAVTVQPTLNADVSGYLTTQNPTTGDPSDITIQANYGLNLNKDDLTSPDVANICRTWKNEINISSTQIGTKSHKIIIGDHGINKIENNNDPSLFCLTKQQLLQIARAGIEVEKALGKALKINWAFYKDQLFILSTSALPNPIKNSTILTDNIFNSNPICTLSKSTIVKYLDEVLQQIYYGKKVKKGGLKKLVINGENKQITEESKIHEMLTTGDFFINKKDVSWIRTLKFCWDSANDSEEAAVLSKAMKLTSPPVSTASEHLKIIKRNLHLLKHLIYLHTKVNQSYIFYQKLFFNLLHENPFKISSEDLLSFLSHFSTRPMYQISTKVELLAAVIKNRDFGHKFIGLPPKQSLELLENEAPDCLELFEQIIDEFGTRGPNECDFLSEPWEVNISALIKIIQKIIQKGVILGQSSKKHPKLNGLFLKWLDTRLHNIFTRRSQTLEAITVAVNKFRWSYLDLGVKLVHEGKLPNQNLIFHLTQNEIESIVREKQPDLVAKALERSISHKNLITNEDSIIGSTVVGGHVSGRACVLENIGQIDLLQPGDILVTKSLDLGWSPFFGAISGLICDTGSLVSEGAIAVYKKNLPCLIAENATNILKTGDQVVVTAGAVKKFNK